MEQRLGQNGIDDFRNHPFFEGIDWDNLGDSKLLLFNIFSLEALSHVPCLALFWKSLIYGFMIGGNRLCLNETSCLNCNYM